MVTIKEIAKIAGVSTATVSHVINSSRFVSAEITNRVHEAMTATGYKPNIAAYALRTQKTKTIGLLLPILMDETSNVYFMQMMLGIEAVFEAEGYCVILGNTQENVQVEKQMLEHFQNRMVDGLIVAPTCDSQAFVREILGEKPTVFVDREPQELKGVDCVVNDTQRGSREAVEMLIKEGHRHIGILSGILGKNTMADLRIQGYLEAMEKYDIPVDQDWILEGESSRMAGYRMMQMLAEKDDITAVFISSNIVAMGAVEYLNRHPKHQSRIQIVVYDDYEWVNTCVQPFTTIRQDAKCLGETAARMLLSRIADPQKKTEVRRLPTSLIRR